MRSLSMRCLLGVLALGSLGAVTAQQPEAKAAQTVAAAPRAKERGAASQETAREIRRGEQLATFGGCHDCHTPKIMTAQGPQPDRSRLLSGYPAGAPLPAVPPGLIGPNQWGALATNDLTGWAGPWGRSFAANLTPDATGIRAWTPEQFIQTMRTGKHLGVGRAILPPMPWFDVAALSDRDLRALFAYLKSLKPVANQVPPPLPPG